MRKKTPEKGLPNSPTGLTPSLVEKPATAVIPSDKIQNSESMLWKEYAEINQYIRLTCQLGITWYTFLSPEI